MKKQKMFVDTLCPLILSLLITVPLYSQTPTPADGFQFPSEQNPGQGNWSVGCNPFWGTCVKKWHTGEDASGNAGDPVYAPAHGVVKHTGARTSYGNVIVIEHNINGEIVCSVLGHLRSSGLKVKVGQNIDRGDLLGYLGTYTENGNWTPHYHFGINRGSYQGDNKAGCSVGSWWYSGYTSCKTWKSKWYDPSDFVNSHPALVGYYSDGWHTDGSSQEFVNEFVSNGGYTILGTPYDRGEGLYVHDRTIVGTGPSLIITVQDFRRESDGYFSELALNPNDNQVYVVHGQELAFWRFQGDAVGYPMSNEVLGNYAGGSAGQAGENILIVQKFHYTKTGDKLGNTVTYHTQDAILGHYPVGQFKVDGPQAGLQYYIQEAGAGEIYDHWPRLGKFTPTGYWWTDTGDYFFFWIDSQGEKRDLLVHTVHEGNEQIFSPPSTLLAVTNLTATVISNTQINLTWADDDNGWTNETGIEYIIYESGQSIMSVFDQTSFSATNLTPGTNYTFQVRVSFQGDQSGLSSSVTATTLGSAPTGSFISLLEPYPNPVQAT